LDESTQTYRYVSPTTSDVDATIPPFPKYLEQKRHPVRIRLTLYLDKEKPLSEPKWVKSGDIEEWLKSIFGTLKMTDSKDYAAWNGKIVVVDPDPPSTIYTVIDAWAQHSTAGPLAERLRFVNTHLKGHYDNLLEILLRLVRGDGSNSSRSTNGMQVYGSSLTSALSTSAPFHAAQQTHVSLAVLALFRLTGEYAETAGEDPKVLEHRVGEIIRALPQHLVHKSLDGIFRDWWTAEKKTGRTGLPNAPAPATRN